MRYQPDADIDTFLDRGPLYAKLVQVPEALLAFESIESSLLKRDWTEAIRLLNYTAKCIGVDSLLHPQMSTSFAEKLLEYPFTEIIVSDDRLINQLRARWSYINLIRSTLVSPRRWQDELELVAVLFGEEYDVVLDPSMFRGEPPELHSPSRGEWVRYCPTYFQFTNLTREGRRCMTFALHCNFSGNLINGGCMRKYLHEGYNSGSEECIERGFLSRELKPRDYLYLLENNTLASILNEFGVKIRARKKESLVQQISETLSSDQILKYVVHLSAEGDLFIGMPGHQKFRELLHAEKERFSKWGAYLSNYLCPMPEFPIPPLDIVDHRRSFRAFAFESVLKFDEQSLDRVASHQIWTHYWDAECDRMVVDWGNRLGWNAFRETAESVEKYWGKAKTARFESETDDLMKSLSHDMLDFWNSPLELYCESRRRGLGAVGPVPRNKACVECGQEFNEASIPPKLAKLAGYQFDFCRGCLDWAFYRQDRHTTTPREVLISKLISLCDALEQIPMAEFIKSPALPIDIRNDKAQRIIKELLQLPSYSDYMREFDTWFKALTAASLLKDEVFRTGRGYKSIAADGHECLSLAERTVDDWLSTHSVVHEREPYYPFHPTLNPTERLRADWKVGEYYIEYFGLLDEPEYEARAKNKANLVRTLGLKLIPILPSDILNLDAKLANLTPKLGA